MQGKLSSEFSEQSSLCHASVTTKSKIPPNRLCTEYQDHSDSKVIAAGVPKFG